jgi:hypothetical protein
MVSEVFVHMVLVVLAKALSPPYHGEHNLRADQPVCYSGGLVLFGEAPREH